MGPDVSRGHAAPAGRLRSVAPCAPCRGHPVAHRLTPVPSLHDPHHRGSTAPAEGRSMVRQREPCRLRQQRGSRPRPLRWAASHPPLTACGPSPCPPWAAAWRRPPRLLSQSGTCGGQGRAFGASRPSWPPAVARGHPSAKQGQGKPPAAGLALLLPRAGCGAGAPGRPGPHCVGAVGPSAPPAPPCGRA